MRQLTLAQRLSTVFAILLLTCAGLAMALQIQAGARHEKAVAQQLSKGLADHIASTAQLMDARGWRPDAVRGLFDKLMAVNPSVEVYLLDNSGRIVGNAAPPGHLKRDHVDLAPIHRYLDGEMLPVEGDDPRSQNAAKVFSAAPVIVGDHQAGYVYVILEGESRDAAAARLAYDGILRITLGATVLVALLVLVMGLVAFRLITRPLRALTRAVQEFGADGRPEAIPVPPPNGGSDEISVLATTFAQMAQRIGEQWRELTRQDQQRRDLIATISHDLRTPLTALHGYLETLRLKDEKLGPVDRQRYLDIALTQSAKVGRLAQELFELARLESGLVHPELETFSLSDLVQDVLQKFELAAESHRQQLSVERTSALPGVRADLGMIERVLTNLLDNAIRHTPPGTQITVSLCPEHDRVAVEVRDTGPGIPEGMRAGLFTRASRLLKGAQPGGGLGLVIVQRILQLHGDEVRLGDGPGAAFRFTLPVG